MLSDGGYGIIESVKPISYDEPQTTYNFEVADVHTYYVGNGVLVHNMSGGDCGKKEYYDSIKDAPDYPSDFVSAEKRNVKVKNENLLSDLRNDFPGQWNKVYNNGYSSGQKVSLHYFQHKNTGTVYNFKIKKGRWS